MAIVYRTENIVNKKFYYGVHNGSNDTYLGSGVALGAAIKKYGKDNFIRRTIKEFNTSEEAFHLEGLIVDDLLLADPMCYNAALGGLGGVGKGPAWNKGIKNSTGDSGRKPGFVSHHKGKFYDHPRIILGVTVPSLRVAVLDSGIPTRTLRHWMKVKCKQSNKNKALWEAYVLRINQ